jgi:hypothetical protein
LCIRLGAALVSLVVGSGLLAAKYVAYGLTGSTAILSDAMESIINVVAAIFALGGLLFAGRPADRSHPYGHGKIEFFSAAFEGGMIAFAAVIIVYEAGRTFLQGAEVRALDLGLLITAGAGLINLALGGFLVRTGRRHHSLTLVADGQHVLSDFWTSLGVVVGLLLVRVTGLPWLDPVVAAVVGLNLAWTGARLVRHAAGGAARRGRYRVAGSRARRAQRQPGARHHSGSQLAGHPFRPLQPHRCASRSAGVLVGGPRARCGRHLRAPGHCGGVSRGRNRIPHRPVPPRLLPALRYR